MGFALGSDVDITALSALAGPWPVSGTAIAIGRCALLDHDWAAATSARLVGEAQRLDGIIQAHGWTLVGGTPLFRLYDVGDAHAVQARLAAARIWSRVFAERSGWLRLGLPGDETEWARLTAALAR